MAYDSDVDESGKDTDRKKDLFERAKRCYKRVLETEKDQRQAELDDLRFQVGELQWPDEARMQRQGNPNASPPTPARPMLSISKIDQPIQRIENQIRASRLGVNVHAVSEDADQETAEALQGLYRRIERDSAASQGRLWGSDRALKAGRGYWRIVTDYDEDSDDPQDQEIRIERVLHQERVYFDPSAQRADFSDAKWVLYTAWYTWDDYHAEFPDHPVTGEPQEWADPNVRDPEWVRDGEDKGKPDVLVAEYQYLTEQRDEKGKRTGVTLHRAMLNGFEVMEDVELDGHYLRIVCVVGRELQPFDGKRRWEGLVRKSKDGQRMYNYAASNLVEVMGTEPKVPWVAVEGSFAGHEDQWQAANIRNFPYLEHKAVMVQGQLAPPPMRAQVDSSKMQLSLMALQAADQWIQASTAAYDPSLGRMSQKERSGRAIEASQGAADVASSDFIANVADAVRYEARVVLDLIPYIYDRPGRITRVLGAEEDEKEIVLNQPYTIDPQTGRPMPAPNDPQAKIHDLKRGKYGLSVTVGKSYQTRKEEGSEEISRLLEAQPELMPILGPIYLRFRDFPGHEEMADILKQLRDAKYPMLKDGDQPGPTPEQAQAQVEALKQELQVTTAQLQQAMQELKTDQAKQEAQLLKAQMDNQSRERIAAIKAETELRLAEMERKFEAMQTLVKGGLADEAAKHQAAHETALLSQEKVLDAAFPKYPPAKPGVDLQEHDGGAE